MNIRRIIREEMDDLEWIKDIPVDNRVTTDNWYQGMKVKLNPDSVFADQSEEIGVIIDSEADLYFCSEKDSDSNDSMCYWITVEWEDGYQNNYRIGPYEWDLLIDADSYLNESDDLQWIKDVEANQPFNPQIGFTYRFKDYSRSMGYENINTDDIIIIAVTKDRVFFDTVDRYWQNHPDDEGPDSMYKNNFNRLVKNGHIRYIGPSSINESDEMDGLQWIKDIKPIGVDLVLNKAFYFNRYKEDFDDNLYASYYNVLTTRLVDLGFEPNYHTPIEADHDSFDITGLYAYQNQDGDLAFVFTPGDEENSEEEYERHIKRYAEDESKDFGDNLEVVDAINFVNTYL